MTVKIKNLLYMLVFTALASGLAYIVVDKAMDYQQQEDVQSGEPLAIRRQKDEASGWKTYSGGNLEFRYPEDFSAAKTGGKITLNHSIPFKNKGKCDLMGEDKTYDTLDDFTMSLELKGLPLKAAVKSLSPYIPEENFTADGLKVNPGFIDPYNLGSLSGYTIYEGAEGCGHSIYYFPTAAGKTLVVKKDMVQQLSGVLSSNIAEEILKVPGAISRERSEEMFKDILSSLRILD